MSVVNISRCDVCDADPVLKALILYIERVREKLKGLWLSSVDAVMQGHVLPDESFDLYLVNELGGATIIPTYFSYHDAWLSIMLVDPFEFNWSKLDIHDAWDCHYLRLVSDVLDEQMILWGGDYPSSIHGVFGGFCEFRDLVKSLCVYAHANDSTKGEARRLFQAKY